MDWIKILITVLLLAGIAAILGIILGIAGKVFAVKKDEREEKILNCLPGANCGGCGFAGCANYANAIVTEGAPVNRCGVGGDAVAHQIASIMGVEAVSTNRKRAEVMCCGCEGTSAYKYEYKGMMNCSAVTRLGNGAKECPSGCIGLGECVAACPFDAIHLVDGIAKVDKDKCHACGICVTTCPQHIIRLVPYDSKIFIACSNTEKGAITRKYCEKGCIGCKICEKNCPAGAIKVNNNVAVIDHDLCTECGLCAEKCPRKLIVNHGAKKDDIPTEE